MEWNLADAENRFSELMDLALTEGPQRVHRRKETVVAPAAEEFERLTGRRPTFKDHLGRYIVDGPHFVRSKTTRCAQLADHVAYAAFRYFNAQDNNYLSVVLNRFQSDGRTFQGLRHMEANIAECTCPGCLTMRACAGTLVKV